MPVINLFGLGGAATNIIAAIAEEQNKISPKEFAKLNVVLVDTSSSNYRDKAALLENLSFPVKFFHIPSLDGSGQVRSANVQAVRPHIGHILNDYADPDATLNIVISSASGGSGGPIAGLLTKQLLENGENVLVYMIGDHTTYMYANNTRNTIKSYEAIAQATGRPVVAHYFENDNKTSSREDINQDVSSTIMDYRLLFGGCVHGVDTADLTNFLDYTKVTPEQPHLTLLNNHAISVDEKDTGLLAMEMEENLGKDFRAISSVNIQCDPKADLQSLECLFRVDGTFNYSEKNPNLCNFYFVLTDNYFFDVVRKLDDIVDSYERKAKTRVHQAIDVSDADDSGLIL